MVKNFQPTIERIHPKRRTSIGSYAVGVWFMQDISAAASSISFEQKPDIFARNFMALLADDEYESARQQLHEVTPDSNQHVAFQQMSLSTRVIKDRYTNKRVYANPDFTIATRWAEGGIYRQKLDAELGITELIEDSLGTDGRGYYRDIADRTLDAQLGTTDLRHLTARTIHDAKFWLES